MCTNDYQEFGQERNTKKGEIKRDILNIVHINAQSVQGHMNEIRLLVLEKNLDILCISETWLQPNVRDQYIEISDFNVFRHDVGRGAGVCIYVKDCFKVTEIDNAINRKC